MSPTQFLFAHCVTLAFFFELLAFFISVFFPLPMFFASAFFHSFSLLKNKKDASFLPVILFLTVLHSLLLCPHPDAVVAYGRNAFS